MCAYFLYIRHEDISTICRCATYIPHSIAARGGIVEKNKILFIICLHSLNPLAHIGWFAVWFLLTRAGIPTAGNRPSFRRERANIKSPYESHSRLHRYVHDRNIYGVSSLIFVMQQLIRVFHFARFPFAGIFYGENSWDWRWAWKCSEVTIHNYAQVIRPNIKLLSIKV